MRPERVKSIGADRSRIEHNPGMFTVEFVQIAFDAQNEFIMRATRLAELLEGFLLHGPAFLRRKRAVLQRKNLVGQRGQIQKIFLIPVGRRQGVGRFDFHGVILDCLPGQKRAAAGGSKEESRA